MPLSFEKRVGWRGWAIVALFRVVVALTGPTMRTRNAFGTITTTRSRCTLKRLGVGVPTGSGEEGKLSALSMTFSSSSSSSSLDRWIVIPQDEWRAQATRHENEIWKLLRPGLVPSSKKQEEWRGLDPYHPIYNFLLEYYGIRGAKGVRRLARWCPDPTPLLSHPEKYGILLQGATLEDVAQTLHLRGSIPVWHDDVLAGLAYSPASFFGAHHHHDDAAAETKTPPPPPTPAPYLWYRSVLQTTLRSEPVLHCHGLHEWAMQYQDTSSPSSPPPSAQYQSHLPLRVSPSTIRQVVERKGVSCTHVDALRFFAPAAKAWNRHGADLPRHDQLRLEQAACVHAQMDLLKMTCRLAPFFRSDLLVQALQLALQARRLDVEASPYDASAYGLGVVAVETKEGRREYRQRQVELMKRAAPVRQELLQAYNTLLWLGFGIDEGLAESSGANKDPTRMQPMAP